MGMKVTLYSDGSSRGNPGPGGYGTLLQYIDRNGVLHEREYTEGFENTTNNRMELMGVIRGLEELNRPCQVQVVSDSKYVTDAFNQKWIDSWIRNGWRLSGKKPVKNVDLWERLLRAMESHEVTFTWIKGHYGHPENERCDRLATGSADKAAKKI
jgi:ribonuclease HI